MKILLFGPQNAGKTSLMQTTCYGYDFMKVLNLKPTKGISRENFVYRGVMQLNVWDAGGQEIYIDRYFSDEQRELVFSELTTPIFMVDSTVVDQKIKEYFDKFISYTKEFSPNIEKIYILLNKTDLEDSREDDVYDLLSIGLNGDLKNIIEFTPVSVRTGSAQHRIIEILDHELQKSTLDMQKLGKIKNELDNLKTNTLAEYILFNLPDGLLITSTFSSFDELKNHQLEFLKLEMGTLDTSIEKIYQSCVKLLNRDSLSFLTLSTVVYESDICFIILKEITEGAVVMAITDNKNPEVYSDVMNALSGKQIENLKNSLRTSGY